jgi:hypothetical protein
MTLATVQLVLMAHLIRSRALQPEVSFLISEQPLSRRS